ncbi:MAG: phosphotransferase [Clostridia bacterium]|nr:phosphotransferase [Clostridia bacterium]
MVASTVKIPLVGRIDMSNAAETEKQIQAQLAGKGNVPVELDAEGLEYISSAGLRVLLRLKKDHPALSLTGVNSAVYEILEMTGFTEMMTVEKAYRTVSIDGCEEIGRGANGTIYRIDQDNVVKVYNNADALDDIRHEREMAKLALILGIPTAISYDVVKVGNSYGSVFELLNARSFTKILTDEPQKLDWYVGEFVKLLKKIHGTVVPEGKLKDIKEKVLYWVSTMQSCLPAEAAEKLLTLVQAVPHDNHMIHGDFHTKNIELQNDEVLLIDMDTLSVGNPVFELAHIYNCLIGFSEWDHEHIKRFQGYDFETAQTFWAKALAAYLETEDEAEIRKAEGKIRIVSYTRLLSRSIRHREYETETGSHEFGFWRGELLKLLNKTDTLLI